MRQYHIIILFVIYCSNLACTSIPEQTVSKLTEQDLLLKSVDDLRVLRNEVYARKGYIFKSKDLKDYFESKEWYQPKFSSTDGLLTHDELEYVNLILSVEDKLKKQYAFEYTIDEGFMKSYVYDKNRRLNNLGDPQFSEPDREDQYSILKEHAEYFVLDTFQIDDQISGKLISAEWHDFAFDGPLKLIFLATYDGNHRQVDVVRVGKYSDVSDYFVIEQSEIANRKIEKSIEVTTIIDDNGSVGTTISEEVFEVKSDGTISRL